MPLRQFHSMTSSRAPPLHTENSWFLRIQWNFITNNNNNNNIPPCFQSKRCSLFLTTPLTYNSVFRPQPFALTIIPHKYSWTTYVTCTALEYIIFIPVKYLYSYNWLNNLNLSDIKSYLVINLFYNYNCWKDLLVVIMFGFQHMIEWFFFNPS